MADLMLPTKSMEIKRVSATKEKGECNKVFHTNVSATKYSFLRESLLKGYLQQNIRTFSAKSKINSNQYICLKKLKSVKKNQLSLSLSESPTCLVKFTVVLRPSIIVTDDAIPGTLYNVKNKSA